MSAPMPFDRVADRYDETRGGAARGRLVAAGLIRLLPAGGPILEVGVGTGLVAAGLAELGRPVLGVDLSRRMLEHARDRLPGRIAIADATRLPVPDGALAAAYFVHVLHLVGDVAAVLAEAARVVRPDGVVAATARPDVTEPPGDVHEIMQDLQRDLGVRVRPDAEADIVAVAGRHGLTLADRLVVDHVSDVPSPARMAENVLRRSWSWMWEVDERRWRPAADRALARMRALPDQDRPRNVSTAGPLLAFRRS